MNPPVEQPVDLVWVEVAPGRKRLVNRAAAKRPRIFGNGIFKRHYSHIHGRKLTSWSEYHQANRECGIIDVGTRPERPQFQPVSDAPPGRIVGDDAPRRRMITGT